MNLNITAFMIVDSRGRTDWAVVRHMSDPICLSGFDKNGVYQSFESEAYHLASWANLHGIRCYTTEFQKRVKMV